MKTRIKIGSIAALLCIAMPFLSRLPGGFDWVAQYLPDKGHFLLGALLMGVFALVPAIVVFFAALLSKPPFYFPVLFSTLVALAMLGYWHHDNDLAADAQAAISLAIIPINASSLAFAGGLVGIVCQLATQRLKNGTEQGFDSNA